MGASTREDGLLKLVYPGRQVEIHTEPVSAAEVMKKNPRHYVARPDVFKYPWVVISPESLLYPGEVFYIVPKNTIYGLLKAKGYYNKPNPGQNPPNPRYHHPQHKEQNHRSLSQSSVAGTTPKHRKTSHNLKRPFQQCLPWEGMSSVHEEESVERRNVYQEYKHQNRRNIRQSRIPGCYDDDDDASKKIVCYKPVQVLKPGLKKQDRVFKSENRRVTFASPVATG